MDAGKQNAIGNSAAMNTIKKLLNTQSIWLVLIVMVAITGIAAPVFLSRDNIFNVLMTESIIGILTVGVMWPILSRGIDLSLGAVVALSSVVSASFAQRADYATRMFPGLPPMPIIVAVLAGISVGVIFGLINGLLVAYTRIPAFIATLGTQLIARSMAQLYTNAYPVPTLWNEFKDLGQAWTLGIPNVVWFLILFCVVSGFLLTQTRFGNNVFAIGGNDQAARVAGIHVEKNLVKVYTWCAVCAAFGGVLMAARSGAGNSSYGLNYELDAIAAATVGGASHYGGSCRISGVIAGILILGVLKNAMLILGINVYLQQAFKGLIIIGAVVFDMRKNARKA